MLVVVIVGIASGSALAERLRRRGVDGRRLFVGLELSAAAATLGLLLRLPELPAELLWQRARLQPCSPARRIIRSGWRSPAASSRCICSPAR